MMEDVSEVAGVRDLDGRQWQLIWLSQTCSASEIILKRYVLPTSYFFMGIGGGCHTARLEKYLQRYGLTSILPVFFGHPVAKRKLTKGKALKGS